MTPQEIAALPRGEELDRAVASIVFGVEAPDGNTPKYSGQAALSILEKRDLPLKVGRIMRADPAWSEARQFYAEDQTPSTAKGMFPLRVVAATPSVALAKLACIYCIVNKP